MLFDAFVVPHDLHSRADHQNDGKGFGDRDRKRLCDFLLVGADLKRLCYMLKCDQTRCSSAGCDRDLYHQATTRPKTMCVITLSQLRAFANHGHGPDVMP